MMNIFNKLLFIFISIAIYSCNIETIEDSDLTAPSIIGVTPEFGATGVSINTNIVIEFDERVSSATIEEALLLTINNSNSFIGGNVSYGQNTVTFTPSEPLEYETEYSLRVSGISDIEGNVMSTTTPILFTTEVEPDLIAPFAVDFSISPSSIDVPVNSTIEVTFSEELDLSSLENNVSFVHERTSDEVAIDIVFQNNILKVTPRSTLFGSSSYTLIIEPNVSDLAGNQLEDQVILNFTTELIPISIVSHVPSNEATNVEIIDKEAIITFNKEIDRATVNENTFKFRRGANLIEGSYSVDGKVVTFTADEDLRETETEYNVYLSQDGVKDINGNGLSGDYTFTFKTVPVSEHYVYFITNYDRLNLGDNRSLTSKIEDRNIFVLFPETQNPQKKWVFHKQGDRYAISNFYHGTDYYLEATEPGDGNRITLNEKVPDGSFWGGQLWTLIKAPNDPIYSLGTENNGGDAYLDGSTLDTEYGRFGESDRYWYLVRSQKL